MHPELIFFPVMESPLVRNAFQLGFLPFSVSFAFSVTLFVIGNVNDLMSSLLQLPKDRFVWFSFSRELDLV